MNISINDIDRDNFLVHEHEIAGETCYLVQPNHIGAKWTKTNLHQRSSVWNSNGDLISASFKKFFNWNEQPDLVPIPENISLAFLMEKLDGSTLAVSKYKGRTIIRTRGTVDATKLDNGFEIEVLKKKYPLAFDISGEETSDYTYLFEWVSPVNKIVLDYGSEPDIYLIGVISHIDYSLWSQNMVDDIAKEIGVKRPRRFNYSSVKEMLDSIEVLQGQEGICVYFNGGQEIRKVKSAQYLALHRFKSNATLENTIDLFFEFDQPDYQTFENHLVNKFDYECFDMVRGHASNVCDGIKEVNKIIEGFKTFAEKVKGLSRKDAAVLVIQAYGDTNRASFVFNILDGKTLDKDKIKKILYQVLKK